MDIIHITHSRLSYNKRFLSSLFFLMSVINRKTGVFKEADMSTKMSQGKNGITPPERDGEGTKRSVAEPLRRSEQTREQLLRENELLAQELESRTKENILLNEVISTIGSTLKM